MMALVTFAMHTLTSADGTALHATWWEPAGAPKGAVCRIHGLGEHSGRHEHVARRLAEAGYAVAMIDLRGHGRSSGTRGHLPLNDALDDVDTLLADARSRAPQVPLFLFGHSLGGLIVLLYAMRRTPQVAGVVASAPALRSPVLEQTLKIEAAKRLGSVLPWVAIPSGLDDSGLSRDQSVIDAYRADPYVHDKASFRLGKDGAEGAQWALAHAGQFEPPLLLIHGSSDPIVYPSGTEEFARKVPGDVTLKIYQGLLHEPHNEPEKDEVLTDIVNWLDAHLA